MKPYTKEINNAIRYIKRHFRVDSWPLSYLLNKPNTPIGLTTDENLDIEIEFIGKLLDEGFYIIHTMEGIRIIPLEEEYYV